MATGVNGDHLDHVVRHVVAEYKTILEYATTLSLHVEGKTVLDIILLLTRKNAITFAVQV